MKAINLVTPTVAFCFYFLKVKNENCTYLDRNKGKYLFPVFCRTMPEERAASAVTGHIIAPEKSCCVFLQ